MPTAYEGHEPYIFISYSHRDSDTVMTSIKVLQENGYRVWFDGGIEAGSEWPEYIATHLKNSACVLTFISDNFVDSDNCRRELNFALDLRKPMLNVYLHNVALSDGMRMQLGLNQALKKFNFATIAAFNTALCDARILKECGTQEAPSKGKEQTTEKTETVPQKTTKPTKVTVQDEQSHPAVKRIVCWIGVFLELSYIYFGTVFMDRLTANYGGFWHLFLWMLVPHAAIALLITLLYRTLGKKLSAKQRNDLTAGLCCCCVLTVLVNSVTGTVYCNLDINIVLQVLAVLGLNLIPGMFALGMYAVGCDYK